MEAVAVDLEVRLGRLRLPNPILTASGTFGYAREMVGFVESGIAGRHRPQDDHQVPAPGNKPWRTIETTGGMLNSIGLDNDGIDAFIDGHLPYLASVGCPIVVSIAGCDEAEFAELAGKLSGRPEVAAIELNVSCPNVSGGVDLGTNPVRCERVVAQAATPAIARSSPSSLPTSRAWPTSPKPPKLAGQTPFR
ncbi:MAG: hypothetical protein QM775_15745 [Pirellulales bacterium]